MTTIVICQKLLFFFLFLNPSSSSFPNPPAYFCLPHQLQRGGRKLQRQLVTLVTPAPSPEQLNNIVLKLSLLLPASLNLIHSGPGTPPPPHHHHQPLQSQATNLHNMGLVLEGCVCVWLGGGGWGGAFGDSKAETASLEQHCCSCVNAREQWVRWG